VPVISNYPASGALPQGLIPDAGADIFLIPYEAVEAVARAGDLENWIESNDAMWHNKARTRRLPSWTNDESYPQQIFRVDADYERAPEDGTLQSEVNFYFLLHRAGFRLRMLYWKGDSHRSSFNSALQEVLHSIRAL